MAKPITASILYDMVQCPKRVERDMFDDQADRDEVSPFVAMLWRRGTLYEAEVMAAGGLVALDLSYAAPDDKERLTLEAMHRGVSLIYNGRIHAGDLLGMPDLLRREAAGYIPIDIKSGRGKEGGGDPDEESDEGKPKLHYAVQIALYVDILEQHGLAAGRRGVILDVHSREHVYDLAATRGPKISETLWEEYKKLLGTAREIAARAKSSKGALASSCKLCHWYSSCTADLRAADDLTLIPYLGRAIRDAMEADLPTVAALAATDPERWIAKGKTPFKGVGEKSLRTFQTRARLLTEPSAKPLLKSLVQLPSSEVEFFFDIEVDPLRDFTYLHGIVERRRADSASERFIAFFTEDETPDAERDAFAHSFYFLGSVPTATVWYYSKYERTLYRKLQKRYPEVCSPEAIESLFDRARATDLYLDVVKPATEWPTNDQSIKTLAKYLGFAWRDNNPSGAASIEWFDQWVRTRDPAIRQRILDYNEDDCKATRVLLDGIRSLA